MSSIPVMMAELIEALPPGVTPTEVGIRCRSSDGDRDVHRWISVLMIEHATFPVGKVIASEIAEVLKR